MQNKKHYIKSGIIAIVFLFIVTVPNPVAAISVIGFGDSITQGYPYISQPGYGRRIGGYEPKLEALFAGAGYAVQVLNYGAGGETAAQGVGRIDSVLSRTDADGCTPITFHLG